MRGMQQDRYHHKDVFEHTLQVIDRAPPTVTLRWAALLHDIAKPPTRSVENGEVHFFGHERVGAQMAQTILSNLRLDRHTIERVSLLVEMHQRANSYEADWTDGAVRRSHARGGRRHRRSAGPLGRGRDDATAGAQAPPRSASRRCSSGAEIRAQEDVAKIASPLDGHELMALFAPRPWIKPIKERLLTAVLDGSWPQRQRHRGRSRSAASRRS